MNSRRSRTPKIDADHSLVSKPRYLLPAILALIAITQVARANDDSGAWSDDFAWAGIVGGVHALASFHGELIVGGGGSLTTPDGLAHGAAAWDGESWRPLGNELSGTVRTLISYDGRLIAGGDFDRSSSPLHHIAAWDGTSWVPLGTGTSGPVSALAEYEGDLYVGGNFDAAGGIVAPYIARWTGSTWESLQPALNNEVAALAVHQGRLIIGGRFTRVGDDAAGGLAVWNGARIEPLGSGIDGGGVLSLSSFRGDLIVGGQFVSVNETPARGVARWNGSELVPLPDDMGGTVFSLAVFDDRLYASGYVSDGEAQNLVGIAAWDGGAWEVPGLGLAEGRGVGYTMVVHGDRLMVGGSFGSAGNRGAPGVAAWNGGWETIGVAGQAIHGRVRRFFNHGDELIALGDFRNAGQCRTRDIAAWDGSGWHALGSGLDQHVTTAIVYDGDLVVAGYFDHVGDLVVPGIAAWDGSEWRALGPDSDDAIPERVINSMVGYGPDLLVCGTSGEVSRWDGRQWHRVAPVPGDDIYRCYLAVATRELHAIPYSYPGSDATRGTTYRWDGVAWRPVSDVPLETVHFEGLELGVLGGQMVQAARGSWVPYGPTADGEINGLDVVDGVLFAYGHFARLGNVDTQGLAYFDGLTWHGFGNALEASVVHDVVDFQGDLHVGGIFFWAGGVPAAGIARRDVPIPEPSFGVLTILPTRPNPFVQSAHVSYVLPTEAMVRLRLFDVQGRSVRTLVDTRQQAGKHWANWTGLDDQGRAVGTGVYFLRFEVGNAVTSQRLVKIE